MACTSSDPDDDRSLLLELPPEVLVQVVAMVDAQTCSDVMPVVCRTLKNILTTSGARSAPSLHLRGALPRELRAALCSWDLLVRHQDRARLQVSAGDIWTYG